MAFKTDFTGVDSGGFDALPAGQYPVTVTNGELKESGPNAKNPGAEYVSWELTVDEGHENAGRKFWLITSLLPQALFGLKGLLLATGKWTEEELNAAGGFSWSIEDDVDDEGNEVIGVVGSQVIAKVIQRVYEGEKTNAVKGVKSASEAQKEAAGSLLP